MITLYGISNCDTIKKSRAWLQANGLDYEFHDYKKASIDQGTLTQWCRKLGYEKLLNTRGTTWRKLDEHAKANMDESKAITLMQEHTSLIKRPVLVTGKNMLVGFDEDSWKSLL
jgi:arsenate reductase